MRRVLAFLVLAILLGPVAVEAACLLKQSTAVDIALGPFVDATDGVTAETGLTISQADVRLKKGAGNWAQKNDANACTHEENGWYECALNTTDTNTLGPLVVAVAESGALPVWMRCEVVAAYDALVSTAPGASTGLLISGSNSGTTTLGALTVTGATTHTGNVVHTGTTTYTGHVLYSDGIAVAAPSTANRTGVVITGNGTGNGATVTSGNGATGNALALTAASTNGNAAVLTGVGTGTGFRVVAGATGDAMELVGGGTSGKGLEVTTTSGDGISVTPTAGSALVLTANGTSKHGLNVTGGTAGTSHGALFTAGSGGSDLVATTGITVDACTGCSTAGGATVDNSIAIIKDSTSQIVEVFIRDSSTNLGKTGVDHTQAGLKLRYCRSGNQGDADCADITPADSTRGTYTSGGVQAKDDADAAGIVEIGLPTAVVATGADRVVLYVSCTGCLPTIKTIELVDVGLGPLSAKVGTPAGASIAADIAAEAVKTAAIKAKTDSLNFSGSNVLANTQATASSLTVDITGSITGNLSGSVGSVSGAVGSVTGNVGGNVTGNVGGNVTGSVGSVASGGITAASFGAGAIDATAIAANAIGSSEIANGAITAAKFGAGAIDATAIASDAITAAKIADAAIDLATFASGVLPSNLNAMLVTSGGVTTAGGTYRKNVASQLYAVYLVDSSGDAVTGATVTVKLSKDGAAAAAIGGSVAEIDAGDIPGWYLISLAQADTNCNLCVFQATAVGVVPRAFYFTTAP